MKKRPAQKEQNQDYSTRGVPWGGQGEELWELEFYERCGKAIGIAIILSKRKGGIYIYENLPRFFLSLPCTTCNF
jgi:hypothetical protein